MDPAQMHQPIDEDVTQPPRPIRCHKALVGGPQDGAHVTVWLAYLADLQLAIWVPRTPHSRHVWRYQLEWYGPCACGEPHCIVARYTCRGWQPLPTSEDVCQ